MTDQPGPRVPDAYVIPDYYHDRHLFAEGHIKMLNASVCRWRLSEGYAQYYCPHGMTLYIADVENQHPHAPRGIDLVVKHLEYLRPSQRSQ